MPVGRVLERVRQGLLDDAVGGELHARVERPGAPGHRQLHALAGRADVLQELAQAVQAGHRGERPRRRWRRPHRPGPGTRRGRPPPRIPSIRRMSVIARRPLASIASSAVRASAGRRSSARSAAPAWITITLTWCDDDVVQLAGDPLPLLRHGQRRAGLALALGPRRSLLDACRCTGAAPAPTSRRATTTNTDSRLWTRPDRPAGHADLDEDQRRDPGRRCQRRHDARPPVAPLRDGEQGDEPAEAGVERRLGEQPLADQRAHRDEEHGHGRHPPEGERQRLEQDEHEADGLDPPEVARTAGDGDDRDGRQAEGDERVDEQRVPAEACRDGATRAGRVGAEGHAAILIERRAGRASRPARGLRFAVDPGRAYHQRSEGDDHA